MVWAAGACGLSHKESLHQITTVPSEMISYSKLSHKESLHQITTPYSPGNFGGDCHTKNHCIKSQLPLLAEAHLVNCHTKNHCIKSQLMLDELIAGKTVTQRIIASNHNSLSARRFGQILSHKESLHQITTLLEDRLSSFRLSHKESLHQITTLRRCWRCSP